MRMTKEVTEFLAARATEVTDFRPGDLLRISYREDDGPQSQPLQWFEGVCVARRHGKEAGATFTLRKESHKVGVEKTFMIHSPRLESLEVKRKGKVRRAKLFYLRGRSKKEARIKERK
ncbi:50S ribosomal protein L19 [bacterium]|nr:50S ribosomal protein L19 [bacterium]